MYKKLKEDYINFKNEVTLKESDRFKLINELKEEDKCPFCYRFGSTHILTINGGNAANSD